MTIHAVQRDRAVKDILRSYLTTGHNPTNTEVLTVLSQYFSLYPAGLPLPLPLRQFDTGDGRSNADSFNELLSHLGINIDVLYEALNETYGQLMALMSSYDSYLESLRIRRIQLGAKIENYLLSQYNTDGYFFAAADTFASTDFTDLSLTNAYIDTELSACTLPTLSHLSERVGIGSLQIQNVEVLVDNKLYTRWREISPFLGGIRSARNNFWALEVDTDQPSEVVVKFTVAISAEDARPVELSRIEYEPYGATETQVFVETINNLTNPQQNLTGFGNRIQTSTNRMVFLDEAKSVRSLNFTLRKTQPDYTANIDSTHSYRYFMGAKEISFMKQIYDQSATFVSTPLRIDASLNESTAIDAVSLVVDHFIPSETTATYYVASDPELSAPQIGDFNWMQIQPLGKLEQGGSQIIRFNGSQTNSKMIRLNPSASEVELIGPDVTNHDLTKRNPSPAILPGFDVYRIAKFTDAPLFKSLKLEEGINTTRIYHTQLNSDATKDFSYWQSRLNTPSTAVTFGRIDNGNDFFYGGDVGRSGSSVFVETYLELVEEKRLVTAQILKADVNSKNWDVRVLLNGRSIAWLPAGTDQSLIPWPFTKGLNHIALLINIPFAEEEKPEPYLGTIQLMGSDQVYNYGTVKLDTWSYVDPFDLEHNTIGDPSTFTILNEELITLRKFTDNFRIQYATTTSIAPNAIRLRADFSRSSTNSTISPVLNGYRVRFAHGDQ